MRRRKIKGKRRDNAMVWRVVYRQIYIIYKTEIKLGKARVNI